jgi:hypothetical protein
MGRMHYHIYNFIILYKGLILFCKSLSLSRFCSLIARRMLAYVYYFYYFYSIGMLLFFCLNNTSRVCSVILISYNIVCLCILYYYYYYVNKTFLKLSVGSNEINVML